MEKIEKDYDFHCSFAHRIDKEVPDIFLCVHAAAVMLASSPGPSSAWRKHLVHTDCACTRFYPESWYFVYRYPCKIFSLFNSLE